MKQSHYRTPRSLRQAFGDFCELPVEEQGHYAVVWVSLLILVGLGFAWVLT